MVDSDLFFEQIKQIKMKDMKEMNNTAVSKIEFTDERGRTHLVDKELFFACREADPDDVETKQYRKITYRGQHYLIIEKQWRIAKTLAQMAVQWNQERRIIPHGEERKKYMGTQSVFEMASEVFQEATGIPAEEADALINATCDEICKRR